MRCQNVVLSNFNRIKINFTVLLGIVLAREHATIKVWTRVLQASEKDTFIIWLDDFVV